MQTDLSVRRVGLQKNNRFYLYPCSCTLDTDRPEGSFRFLNAASHSNAIGVLQATEGTEGTHFDAASDGKKSVKMVR